MQPLCRSALYARARAAGPFAVLAVFCLVVFVAMLGPTPARAAAWTERVSVSSTGEEGNSVSGSAAVSADGRFVAFDSDADDLVADDTNGRPDIFAHDRQTGLTERVNVSSAGEQANDFSFSASAAISADGRYVAFSSDAFNLVPGDTNNASDVFVHDRQTGLTERVSVNSAGEEGDADSVMYPTTLSADGRFVAFGSFADNLVPDDIWGTWDVFVHDRQTGTTERASASSTGGRGGAYESGGAALSADGRFVAFDSFASDLVPDDTNDAEDVFVYDRQTGATERVSVNSTGEQADSHSGSPVLSADGRFAAFASVADSLAPGDTNGIADIFAHDRQTGATERVNVSSAGEQAEGLSGYPAISADGRYVVFSSAAANLVPGDTNGQWDTFVHDRRTGAAERVNVDSAGGQADSGASGTATLSADGRLIAFSSDATNLVPGDANGTVDVFVRVRSGFHDVFGSDWAYGGILACLDAHVVDGYGDGTYRPTLQVTRDQMAVYVSRALVIPSGDAAIPDPQPLPAFPDVAADHWAYRWIEYAVSQNVVQGYPGGAYHPDEVVNRGQMAVYMARAMVSPTGDAAIPNPDPGAPPAFPDVTSENEWAWCYKYVEYCAAEGIVQGYWNGTYHPERGVTRDQMAVYVARAFGLAM